MLGKVEPPDEHSFLQSSVWAQFKSEFGWRRHRLDHLGHEVADGSKSGSVSVLSRKAAPGVRLAYVPHGAPSDPAPNSASDSSSAPASSSISTLVEFSRNALSGPLRDCGFIRWDLPWETNPARHHELKTAGFKAARVDIQPPNTVILDLSKSADELLTEMKSKTRYNIRLAARKGVVLGSEGVQALDEWYELYRQTSRRDSISIHSQEYYQRLFELVGAAQGTPNEPVEIELLCARHEGELIAGIVVVYYRQQAVYLYGAGADHKRNLMAAYLLQWSAIERAQARGCVSYDLFGIPPSDDPQHPMHGLYRFKVGFGGAIVQRLGCWDYTQAPGLYTAFCSAEAVRNWYFKTFLKRR